jgi:hypothetical protein
MRVTVREAPRGPESLPLGRDRVALDRGVTGEARSGDPDLGDPAGAVVDQDIVVTGQKRCDPRGQIAAAGRLRWPVADPVEAADDNAFGGCERFELGAQTVLGRQERRGDRPGQRPQHDQGAQPPDSSPTETWRQVHDASHQSS